MKTIAAITLVAAAVAAGTGAAAQEPVADAPGLAVAQGGRIYVGGKPIARGAQPAWSPNGTQIAFRRDGQIFVIGANGKNERRLTRREPGLHWPGNSPAWSRDGKRLAFSGTRDLFTVTVAGRRLTALTRAQHSWLVSLTPAYSPDGRTIAFSRNVDWANRAIYLMNADGTGLRRLTYGEGTVRKFRRDQEPTWSPDGRTVVFASNRDGNGELYAVDRNGRNGRRITRTPHANEQSPRFSRDGRRLLYVHEGRVAMMNVDGTGVRELGFGTAADWRR
jgi:Tol biopolymer transport system component